FGDSNTWGWQPIAAGFPTARYDDNTRWAGVLNNALENTTVIVDGMVGRRSNIDGNSAVGAIEAQDFNGAKALPESIARNMPLDLVVIMLGTNDLQNGTERAPAQVAEAVFDMAQQVVNSHQPLYSNYTAPKVLVVSPAVVEDTAATPLNGLFEAAQGPSAALAKAFASQAKSRNTPYFDAAKVVKVTGVDGIHLDRENHARLGTALAPVVSELLSEGDE
ncbi:MAG: GDSL-type esterase/lipase family protein, partial [Pseudomonadales bacterium]